MSACSESSATCNLRRTIHGFATPRWSQGPRLTEVAVRPNDTRCRPLMTRTTVNEYDGTSPGRRLRILAKFPLTEDE